MFPAFLLERGSGPVVTFLGKADGDNTFVPAGRPRSWLFKYMHQRFFFLSDGPIEVLARVAAGDESDWPHDPAEALERQRGEGGRSFNLSRIRGTATICGHTAAQPRLSRLPGDAERGQRVGEPRRG
jgi:hypothetical protein